MTVPAPPTPPTRSPKRRDWGSGFITVALVLLGCGGGGWCTGWVLNHIWDSYLVCVMAAFVVGIPTAWLSVQLTNERFMVVTAGVTLVFFGSGLVYLVAMIQGTLGPEGEVSNAEHLQGTDLRYAALNDIEIHATSVASWTERHLAGKSGRTWFTYHGLFPLGSEDLGIYLHHEAGSEAELAAATTTPPRWIKRLENQFSYAEHVETIAPAPPTWTVFHTVESPETDRGLKVPMGVALLILMLLVALIPLIAKPHPKPPRETKRRMGPYR